MSHPDVPIDLLGIVDKHANFRHTECIENELGEATLLAMLDDEDKNTVVLEDDGWTDEVGLCVICHLGARR